MPNNEPESVAELRQKAHRARTLARGLSLEDRERLLQFADELDTRATELARERVPASPE